MTGRDARAHLFSAMMIVGSIGVVLLVTRHGPAPATDPVQACADQRTTNLRYLTKDPAVNAWFNSIDRTACILPQ